MKPILVPTSDVNSENATLVSWKHEEGTRVEAGGIVAEVETSKAVIEVLAPEAGILGHDVAEASEFQLARPIGSIFDSVEELHRQREARAAAAGGAGAETDASGVSATLKARKRAEELGVDLRTLKLERLITVKDVEDAAATQASTPAHIADVSSLPRPLSAPPVTERVLLIGGSRAATQVIDIFRDGEAQRAVAILDDNEALWGKDVYGVPICGGTSRLRALYNEKLFDAVVIAISTSTAARAKFRGLLGDLGIPMTNAIDRSSKLSRDVTIGKGNVICAFCHFGTGAVIGDNNFISAYNSYDHHSVIGNDASTGPGCISSGRARLGDRVRLGAGIFFEPGVELGEGVQVASGAILVKSVPAHHAVKTKIVATTVVPIRK
jgi:biotin-dependent enzyme